MFYAALDSISPFANEQRLQLKLIWQTLQKSSFRIWIGARADPRAIHGNNMDRTPGTSHKGITMLTR